MMEENEVNLEALTAKAEGSDAEAVEAQYELGWRHALGMGVELDDDVAVEWLQQAAAAGHMLAQNNLGARHFSGDGVEQDLLKAYRFFFQAANQGDRKAGKNLDAVARQLSPGDLDALRAEMGAPD
ncbi:MAG: sel1 repeat family protein [Verrucomicrobia subdivision 3 bacterium]|nr:sel1 repeat family protein [Limisphaerales bacterium]